MANYDPSPQGLENLGSVFTEGADYFNTHFPSSTTLEKETFFFGGDLPNSALPDHSEIAIQSMEDRFKNSNTFGEFSIGNTFGEGNFPLIISDFQPSKTNWQNLYNENHTIKNDVGYNYSGNINRDRLNIRSGNPSGDTPIGSGAFSRSQGGQNEPYIVSKIPLTDNKSGGREINFGSREVPVMRSVTDLQRISKFMASNAGLAFIAKQEALGFQAINIVNDGKDNVLRKQRQYKSFYNPLSTLLSIGPTSRLLGYGPNVLYNRDFPPSILELFGVGSINEYGMDAVRALRSDSGDVTLNQQKIDDVFHGIISDDNNTNQFEEFFAGLFDLSGEGGEIGPSSETRDNSGDPHTLMPVDQQVVTEPNLDTQEGVLGQYNADILEGTATDTYGMPFYFKDLRTNNYITFRAYLDGITENISPSWASTNYVGKSEPVYVYERAERDISFNLKLFAHTEKELQMIYKKMNKLTSLCYPEYHADSLMDDKTRMKPPMTKFRLGELFGSKNNEMVGFIKSLTYTIPDEGVWETEYGKRVPKYVTAAISYQVIHAQSPNLDTIFYGYNQNVYKRGAIGGASLTT